MMISSWKLFLPIGPLFTPAVHTVLVYSDTLSQKQTFFNKTKTNNFKMDNNLIANRLYKINNIVNANDLHPSLSSFKDEYTCELLFIENWVFKCPKSKNMYLSKNCQNLT